mmetsp:Transcript_41570/g.114514  ORF Transcript_41570/g.114514 Transcript_41570/m.114514 type:complete len:533 (+) Transcript_41570:57-1655(+)
MADVAPQSGAKPEAHDDASEALPDIFSPSFNSSSSTAAAPTRSRSQGCIENLPGGCEAAQTSRARASLQVAAKRGQRLNAEGAVPRRPASLAILRNEPHGSKPGATRGDERATSSREPRCRDLKGSWHDVKQLRRMRNAAVLRGMKCLHKQLVANRCEGLVEIGDDGACIFFEIWYTSSDSTIRSVALGIAQDLLERFETHLLNPARCRCKQCHRKASKETSGAELFMALMYLLRCKEEMGLDTQDMLRKADELWKEHNLSDTNVLFGRSPSELADVTDGDWIVLIMNIMVMEFNQLLFRRRWPLQWGLRETFAYLRTHKFIGPPYDKDSKFHDSFYLATHVVFAISAYSAIKTNPKDVPWLFEYNRRAALYWVKQAWMRLSGRQSDRLVDIDGLAEAVDVMRGCGQTDGGDPLLCSATLVLLELQRPDGSWPYWILSQEPSKAEKLVTEEPSEPAFYSRIHPTWTAVQSLRDRNFEYDRKGNMQWAQFMSRLLKQTNLRKLETKISYPKRSKSSAKSAEPVPCEAADARES